MEMRKKENFKNLSGPTKILKKLLTFQMEMRE